MHVLESCEASAQYSPINFFVNLFHSKNSNLPHCFSDLIHTEYRKLHKNNGHSPFVLPSIMRSSVGQCRNIRFRQLSASHVIITSEYVHEVLVNRLGGLSLPRKSVVRLTDRPDMTLDVYRGRKTTIQQQQQTAKYRNPISL